ncbi:MAG: hypothetical protein ACRCZF_17495, partial [Gemmataceae bacterium]
IATRQNMARNAIEDWRSRAGLPPGGLGSPSRSIPAPVASTAPAAGDGDYRVGMLVQHADYGVGKITDVSGYGALRRLKIRFPTAGEKTFVADKVRLTTIAKS